MDTVIFTDDNGVIAEDQRLAVLANRYAEDVAERARRAVLGGPEALRLAEREYAVGEAVYAAYAAATGVRR